MAVSPKVETLIKHAATSTGEGPHWEERTNKLLYVDILNHSVARVDVDSKEEEKFRLGELGDFATFIIPSDSGGYIVSSTRKFCHLDWDTKTLTNIVEVPTIGTNDRFNDGKCDKNGRLWAGTMGYEPVPAEPEMGKGCLYSLTKGKVKPHANSIDLSNGMAWTHDNSVMFFVDSMPRLVYAYDFDLATGEIANKRTCVDFNQWTMEEAGLPDGMTIDQEGKIWVAGYSSSKVMQFDPVTGQKLRHVTVPSARATSCCFGGRDYSDMYVTSSRSGLTDERMAECDPLAGSLFKVTGLGAKGVPAYNYSQ